MKVLNIIGAGLSVLCVAGMAAVGANASITEATRQAYESYQTELECLALNIYHEARGESELGQMAVGFVTLNRVNNRHYPSTVCAVTTQARRDVNGVPIRHQCQFSWYCDGRPDVPQNSDAYSEAVYIAALVIHEYGGGIDPTLGAIMYHSDSVRPYWRSSYERTTQIESHIFYR